MSDSVQVQKGLEGVVADTTAVSLVDGEAGRLYYRGQPIESLIQHSFAEVLHLVVFGDDAGPRAPAGSRGISLGRRPTCRRSWLLRCASWRVMANIRWRHCSPSHRSWPWNRRL